MIHLRWRWVGLIILVLKFRGCYELTATHVELCSSGRTGCMQCNYFSTEEIVSCCNICRNQDIHSSAAGVQVLGSPVIIVTRSWASSLTRLVNPTTGVLSYLSPCILKDFKPARGSVGWCRRRIGNFRHIHQHWSVMSTTYGFIAATAVSILLDDVRWFVIHVEF